MEQPIRYSIVCALCRNQHEFLASHEDLSLIYSSGNPGQAVKSTRLTRDDLHLILHGMCARCFDGFGTEVGD